MKGKTVRTIPERPEPNVAYINQGRIRGSLWIPIIVVLVVITVVVGSFFMSKMANADETFIPAANYGTLETWPKLKWISSSWPEVPGRPVDCIGSPPESCGVMCFYLEPYPGPDIPAGIGTGGIPEPDSEHLSCITWRFDDLR